MTIIKKMAGFKLSAVLLACGALPAVQAGTLAFDQGFEQTTLSSITSTTVWKLSTDGSGILAPSSAFSREGSKSLFTEIIKDGSSNYRQELRLKLPSDSTPMADSPPFWFGFSVYVPKSSSIKDQSVIAQWHLTNADSRNRSPVIGLRIQDGQWKMTREVGTWTGANFGAVTTDVWTDWVFKVVWRTNTTGTIQVWKNGKEVLNWQNLQTGPSTDKNIPFMKIGRYSSSFKLSGVNGTVHRSYIDAVRVAFSNTATYKDVAPGAGSQIEPLAPVLTSID